MQNVDLLQVPKVPHPQEGVQQCGPPQVDVVVELNAEHLEAASRPADFLEDFDPMATTRVDITSAGVFFVYLQSNVSKVDLVALANSSEPCMSIGGALQGRVS